MSINQKNGSDISPKHALRKGRKIEARRREWLKRTLCRFNEHDSWTVRDAVEGTQIFGGPGSAKTSGSGRNLAVALIQAGFGGIVLCAKEDESSTWNGYCEDAGVEPTDRLVEISPESFLRINLLSYLYGLAPQDEATATRRVCKTFLTTLGTGDGEVSNVDPYWNDALSELLTHGFDQAAFAKGSAEEGRFRPPAPEQGVQLQDVVEIIRTAAQTLDEARSRSWLANSDCGEALRKANEVYKLLLAETPISQDFRDTVHYWLRAFPTLSDRTRSVIVSSFTSKATGLLRSPIRELFCTTTDEEATPEATFRGKILLLNLPVKTYGEAGRIAQVLYKTVWQAAVETPRRWLSGGDEWRPVFLWADESQNFVTSEDASFQATARSQMAATVYLTQNISNYYHVLGGSKSSATDALLGSLQMKIFHANGDPATNEWAERLFGTERFSNLSTSSSTVSGKPAQFGQSHQLTREPILPSSAFTLLQRGGGEDLMTECFIFHAGKKWKGSGRTRNYLLHKFSQVGPSQRK